MGYKEKVPAILKDNLDDNTKEKYSKKQNEGSQWSIIKKYYKEKVGEAPGIWQKNRRIVLGLGTHTA
ncbi:MAG TPA: hypothetical protein VEG39_06260 [Clostridia bacterium]|nr:hypothetical protein [Clostridia bacterium]